MTNRTLLLVALAVIAMLIDSGSATAQNILLGRFDAHHPQLAVPLDDLNIPRARNSNPEFYPEELIGRTGYYSDIGDTITVRVWVENPFAQQLSATLKWYWVDPDNSSIRYALSSPHQVSLSLLGYEKTLYEWTGSVPSGAFSDSGRASIQAALTQQGASEITKSVSFYLIEETTQSPNVINSGPTNDFFSNPSDYGFSTNVPGFEDVHNYWTSSFNRSLAARGTNPNEIPGQNLHLGTWYSADNDSWAANYLTAEYMLYDVNLFNSEHSSTSLVPSNRLRSNFSDFTVWNELWFGADAAPISTQTRRYVQFFPIYQPRPVGNGVWGVAWDYINFSTSSPYDSDVYWTDTQAYRFRVGDFFMRWAYDGTLTRIAHFDHSWSGWTPSTYGDCFAQTSGNHLILGSTDTDPDLNFATWYAPNLTTYSSARSRHPLYIARIGVTRNSLDPEDDQIPRIRCRLFTSVSGAQVADSYGDANFREFMTTSATDSHLNCSPYLLSDSDPDDGPVTHYLVPFLPAESGGVSAGESVNLAIEFIQFEDDDPTTFKIHSVDVWSAEPSGLSEVR